MRVCVVSIVLHLVDLQNHPENEDFHRAYDDITIAFRGTLSLTNVQFDLKLYRKKVPGRYWFGGAYRKELCVFVGGGCVLESATEFGL